MGMTQGVVGRGVCDSNLGSHGMCGWLMSSGLFPRLCRIKGLGHVSGASRCFLRLYFRSIKTVVQYKIHPTGCILL